MKTTFWKNILLAASVGLAAAIMTGCGDSKANNAKEADSAAASSEVKLLIVNNEPPLAWADKHGKLHGYEYDIWKEVQKHLPDYEIKIEAYPPETVDLMMEAGDAKVSSEGYYRTKEREKNFILPQNPMGASALMVYVKKGEESKYRDLEDIVKAGLRIAPLTPNGGAYRIIRDWNEKHGGILKEIPTQANFHEVDAIRGIKSGQYDVLITPNNMGVESIAEKEQLPITTLAKPIKVNGTYALVNKKESKLASDIDHVLGELRKDGTLAKISEKYYHADLLKLLDD